ncbi:cytochrome c biogenesis CcdA family protein [Gordonia hydrophobica]|uniref:Cytochrome c biogenesis CcdA family protein n=1 Tax=Gordonia hydrophobica TaxID=40516 RepID=A0ABZ2U6E7_9ACTN|nr:cytochrome c biogenesis CcdA family protein [Gordonia hydrophobica]MBM7365424.1 cytochrome c biogenesis protein CcdA [Gordonia hydrophobica]
MDIGLVAAFAGGILALLSPCAALLLPAFFASTVGARGALLVHGGVFYIGLLVTLLPVGIGVGALAGAVAQHRTTIIAVASVVIVLMGVIQLAGRGFDLGRALPGMSRLQQESVRRAGLLKTFVLGAVSGVAGFCTGPILGAVLTMAATRGMAGAGVLLAVYALGMVVPLLLIAALWNRIGDRVRAVLRGREVVLGRVRLHTTNLIAGIALIVVGVAFWFSNGFIAISEPVDPEVQLRLQDGASVLANPVVDVVVIVAIAAGALLWWARSRRRTTTQ